MSDFNIIKAATATVLNETIKINIRKGTLSAGLNIIRFIDKDTKQYVFYAPSIEVSGYGATEEEAHEMMDHAIKECFTYYMSLGKEGLNKELLKLGWTHSPMFKKEYSKAYVDAGGALKELNAEANSIEHLILTAA